ncbi:MAG TPA: hypothetical protein VKV02_10810, partial [Acidobacteriaceae bacterium]|nr:hypothetical protein [Acidobacteriaceae bacterium]
MTPAVCTVTVTGADALPGTTIGGENLTVAPGGKPVALKATAPVNGPGIALTESVKLAAPPAEVLALC